MFASPNIPVTLFHKDFVLEQSYRILKQIRCALNLPALFLNALMVHHPEFAPGLSDLTFRHWESRGLGLIGDLYVGGSFALLQKQFDLSPAYVFRYIEICDNEILSMPGPSTAPMQILYLLLKNPLTKSLVSQYYGLFPFAASSLHIRDAWASNLGTVISDK